MSDAIALDLFIQDFVTTNKLLNQHYSWTMLVSRRYLEPITRVFQFTSGGEDHHAVGSYLALPETDWFRIELTRNIPDTDHRFDCLRMTFQNTHRDLEIERIPDGPVLVKVITRNRGLINIVFVIHSPPKIAHPLLASAVQATQGIPRLF
jgi:hypothetical protein